MTPLRGSVCFPVQVELKADNLLNAAYYAYEQGGVALEVRARHATQVPPRNQHTTARHDAPRN